MTWDEFRWEYICFIPIPAGFAEGFDLPDSGVVRFGSGFAVERVARQVAEVLRIGAAGAWMAVRPDSVGLPFVSFP